MVPAALLWLAAAAPPPAPKPALSEALIEHFEDFCLNRFPNPGLIDQGVAEQKLVRSGTGRAWTGTLGGTPFTLTVQDKPHRSCAVETALEGDAGTQAVFRLLVGNFVSSHELGELREAPVRDAEGKGKHLRLQALLLSPGPGMAQQRFLNGTTSIPGRPAHTRLVREFAAP
jgi:hypothetical protein